MTPSVSTSRRQGELSGCAVAGGVVGTQPGGRRRGGVALQERERDGPSTIETISFTPIRPALRKSLAGSRVQMT